MEKISVNRVTDSKFRVIVKGNKDATEHLVTLDDKYWKELTEAHVKQEILIKKSFEFLLERESASSILSEFNLSLIEKYFPEYPQKIKEYL